MYIYMYIYIYIYTCKNTDSRLVTGMGGEDMQGADAAGGARRGVGTFAPGVLYAFNGCNGRGGWPLHICYDVHIHTYLLLHV